MISPVRDYNPPKTNPLLRHIDLIESSDAELAIEAFRQASKAANNMGMELVGDFVYTGAKQEITIRVRRVSGENDGSKQN